MTVIEHPSVEERRARGKADASGWLRRVTRGGSPAADRPDPVALLEEQNATREPDLVPVRHGRMMVSPFTFYRGAAKIMAADLKDTPTAGLNVQLCGDAHLSNFGVFASPERTLVFDLNDFDETLPGPFEYDVKRMAASFTIAARNNGFTKADARAATLASVTAYREAMAEFAEMSTMDIWYAHLSEQDLMSAIASRRARAQGPARRRTSEDRREARREDRGEGAHARQPAGAVEARRARRRSSTGSSASRRSSFRLRDLAASIGIPADEIEHTIHEQFRAYRATLQDDRRHLLERFEVVDVARKVVGVGSVGTRAFIVLLQGRDQQDPLFLQVKEATASVLEDHLPKSRYRQPGERVVQGQRMMQAASDIFLGWTKGVAGQPLPVLATAARHEGLGRRSRRWCPTRSRSTRASAARRWRGPTPDRATRSRIAAYLGKKDRFDQSITDFSERYADQNEQDYQAFTEAIRSGRLQALEGV